MKKGLFAALLIAGSLLGGCSTEVTQMDCLEQGRWKHNGLCKKWEDIPFSDQEEVLNEVAEEMAEKNDISKEEALLLMLETIETEINK